MCPLARAFGIAGLLFEFHQQWRQQQKYRCQRKDNVDEQTYLAPRTQVFAQEVDGIRKSGVTQKWGQMKLFPTEKFHLTPLLILPSPLIPLIRWSLSGQINSVPRRSCCESEPICDVVLLHI